MREFVLRFINYNGGYPDFDSLVLKVWKVLAFSTSVQLYDREPPYPSPFDNSEHMLVSILLCSFIALITYRLMVEFRSEWVEPIKSPVMQKGYKMFQCLK